METPFDYFFSDSTSPRTIEALRCGPLASSLETYARRLHEDGYAPHSGFIQLRMLGCFNRWLERKKLRSEDVDSATVERYLRGRAQSGKVRKGDSAALFRLLAMLRPDITGATAPPPTAIEIALGQFQQYLRQERSFVRGDGDQLHACRAVIPIGTFSQGSPYTVNRSPRPTSPRSH